MAHPFVWFSCCISLVGQSASCCSRIFRLSTLATVSCHSCICFLPLSGNWWLFWPKGYLRFIDLLFPSVSARVMPPKGFVDGPVCSDTSAVAKAWAGLVKVQERARVLKHLVVAKGGSEDTDGKTVLPTRENMIHNAELLSFGCQHESERPLRRKPH